MLFVHVFFKLIKFKLIEMDTNGQFNYCVSRVLFFPVNVDILQNHFMFEL